VCFYSHARWPRSQVGRTLPPVPPDLAVEVVSPSNRAGKLHRKIGEYLDAGALMVWVVYPIRRRVTVYRPDEEEPITFKDGEFLENFPELPGFRCAVADFFL
jgi:Uma2 family endonuclease